MKVLLDFGFCLLIFCVANCAILPAQLPVTPTDNNEENPVNLNQQDNPETAPEIDNVLTEGLTLEQGPLEGNQGSEEPPQNGDATVAGQNGDGNLEEGLILEQGPLQGDQGPEQPPQDGDATVVDQNPDANVPSETDPPTNPQQLNTDPNQNGDSGVITQPDNGVITQPQEGESPPANTDGLTKQFIQSEYDAFKQRYGRQFNEEEDTYLLSIFEKKLRQVTEHNNDPTKTYRKGINKFSDLTDQQFKGNFLVQLDLYIPSSGAKRQEAGQVIKAPPGYQIPQKGSQNWVVYNAVNPVRDQGNCGASWSFSTVSAIESHVYVTHKYLPLLSQQHLIDCCGLKDPKCNDGCKGGKVESSFKFSVGGNALRDDYPYAQKKEQCKTQISTKKYLDESVPYNVIWGVKDITYYIFNKGPVSIGVNPFTWREYAGGIFTDCYPSDIAFADHYIVIVGYEEGGLWIMRNSWGSDWGESGYIRLYASQSCGAERSPGFMPKIKN